MKVLIFWYTYLENVNKSLKQGEIDWKNVTNKVEIKIGIRDDGYVEVLSGLIEGENIVAEGLKKVRPKGKIKPIKK